MGKRQALVLFRAANFFVAISDAPPPRNSARRSIVHKANDEIEKSRILKCNGWVQSESEISIPPMARLDLEDEEVCLILERNARERLGTSSSNPGKLVEIHRVCGELSVSRALGDIDFKSAYNDKGEKCGTSALCTVNTLF